MRVLILLSGILATFAAGAQEQLRFSGGFSHNTDAESTYGWELGYMQGLGENAYATLSWLNEGHQENNYRDGLTAQVWARANFFQGRLSLALDVGPYLFFDSVRDEPSPYYSPYENDHGVRPVYSAELTWYMNRSWLIYLRANRVDAEEQLSTSMLLFGLGYQFDGHSTPEPAQDPTAASPTGEPENNEVALYLGRTSLNSFAPENSTAFAAEYRRRLDPYVEWTLGWLNEGGNQINRRSGLTTQFWLLRPLLDDRLALGIGAGVYYIVNQENELSDDDSDDARWAGIISLTARYDFDPHWSVRLSFNRTVTNYDRDSDVVLLGAGYRF